MTITIEEVRSKYPDYNDLSDTELASALHKKFYSDMDLGEFSKKIGVTATPKPREEQIGTEFGKGTVRGASNLSLSIPRAAGSLLFGPPGGALLGSAAEKLAAPSREPFQSQAVTPSEKFASTAGELTGAGVASGGAGTLRGATITAGSALGGATGEQVGGPWGQFIGAIAGGYGAGMANALASKIWSISKDIGATVGAGFGNKAGIERLSKKVIAEKAAGDEERIANALKYPTQYIPGAKVTAGEAIAEANKGQPEQIGGAVARLQKDLYGAKGVEDVLPSVAKEQQAAVQSHVQTVKNQMKPLREEALTEANQLGGIKAAPIIDKIDEMASQPGQRASDVVKKTLTSIKEKLASLVETGGRIDSRDLYTVRKEIGNTIQTHAKETANWDKRLASGLEKDIQRVFDDAIESAGGKGWKTYLEKYSEGMAKAENLIERQKAMKLMQAGVKGQPATQMVSGEIPHAPTLLNRPMMLVNYGLKMVAHDANDPVVKRVATAMTDSKELAKLIQLPINHPERRAMTYILNSLVGTDAIPKALSELQQ